MKKIEPAIGYTTVGSVRGCCGHCHQSLFRAYECLEKDGNQAAKAGQGCYSDRRVVGLLSPLPKEKGKGWNIHLVDYRELEDEERERLSDALADRAMQKWD